MTTFLGQRAQAAGALSCGGLGHAGGGPHLLIREALGSDPITRKHTLLLHLGYRGADRPRELLHEDLVGAPQSRAKLSRKSCTAGIAGMTWSVALCAHEST